MDARERWLRAWRRDDIVMVTWHGGRTPARIVWVGHSLAKVHLWFERWGWSSWRYVVRGSLYPPSAADEAAIAQASKAPFPPTP